MLWFELLVRVLSMYMVPVSPKQDKDTPTTLTAVGTGIRVCPPSHSSSARVCSVFASQQYLLATPAKASGSKSRLRLLFQKLRIR